MNDDERRLLVGAKAIADHLGVTEQQARHWHRVKRIPTFLMGDLVCARVGELDRAIAAKIEEAVAAASQVAAEPVQPLPDARSLLRARRR